MFADLKKVPIFAKIHVGLHLSKALEMKILKRARVAHEQLKVCCSTE